MLCCPVLPCAVMRCDVPCHAAILSAIVLTPTPLLAMQASYSADGIFVSVGGYCEDDDNFYGFAAALYAFPKKALYSNPRNDAKDLAVFRATYLPSSSWYRSLPAADQLLTFDPDYPSENAFNNFVLPSRPQTIRDVHDPYFVMGKVRWAGDSWESVALVARFASLCVFLSSSRQRGRCLCTNGGSVMAAAENSKKQ